MTKAGEKFIRDLPDDKEIRGEYRRLLKLFENAPEQKLNLARKELARAAFLGVTIDRLEKDITMKGYEEDYQNGQNQKGKKKTAAADLHVSYTKNFLAVMKQLHGFLGAETGDEDDPFDSF